MNGTADAAFAVGPTGEMKIDRGRWWRTQRGRRRRNRRPHRSRRMRGCAPTVEDIAPTAAGDPSGTVVFYAIIFISIGASVGAAVFGRLMGSVRTPTTLALRTMTLAGYSALLAGCVTVYVRRRAAARSQATRGRCSVRSGCTRWRSAAPSPASPRHSARSPRSALTLFLVIIGNAAAAGPVGRPLLSGFYSAFNAVVPQGSGVSLLRSIEYFGGNGAQTPLVTLAIWGAAGCLLAFSRRRRG